jgi:membrane-bound lytic murein transglycosylase B
VCGRAALALAFIVVAACAVPSASTTTARETVTPEPSATTALVTPTPAPSPTPTATPRPEPPPLASDPARLAAQIAVAERAIRDQNITGPELAWFGHLQQRAYRRIAAEPAWRSGVLAGLAPELVKTATANIDATAALRATVVPRTSLPTSWRIVEPAPAEELLGYYRDAEAEFGVEWAYLAAVHLVETRMGRIRGTSVAGAQGPMQFMPSTWAVYGEGDIYSNRDSIRAAARYLRANGAPRDMANALFRYNHSDLYVYAVTAYAEVMRAEPDAYRGYYHWQVYYLTTDGDVLLPVGYSS